jgi:hypothetical protein
MTNASMKKVSNALSVFALALVLSMGAFASVANADEWGGDSYSFDGGWGDSYSYDGGFGDSYSYDSGWGDSYSYDGGWGDSYSYDGGSTGTSLWDTDSYSYDGSWGDMYSYDGDNLHTQDSGNLYTYDGEGNLYTADGNWGELYTYDGGGNLYTADGGNLYTAENDYDYDGDYDYVDEYMEEYYQEQYASTGGFTTGGGYSFPSSKSYPSFPSSKSYPTPGCTYCHTPTYPTPTYPTPKPTPGCTTCGGSNTNITNTNITNTNTVIDNSITDNSINIVDNSINDSFNTTVIGDGNVVGAGYQGIAIGGAIAQQHVQVPAPYCVITLTNAGIYGASATLVWSSSNAHSAYISMIGAVAPNGTKVVTGYANQIYTLTVTGQGGTYTCQTQMFTPGYVAPIQNPHVALTQIPYTGLDLGPIGNAMYWLSLISVAAAGAYLAVYYKGGVLALATAAIPARRNHITVSADEAAAIEADSAADETVANEIESTPSTNSLNFLPAFLGSETKDSMSMVRSADGMPRIVIARA